MRGCLVAVVLAGCLPQVGPPVDAGVGGGSGTGGGSGNGGNGGGTGGGSAAGGGSSNDGGPSCSDLMLDGDETDTDCGGSCAPCALDLRCSGPADCESGVCTTGRCAVPSKSCTAFSATACTSFEDHTAPGANRTITFGGGQNIYTPKCITVKLGQTVTFSGSFSTHPMAQACGPVDSVLGQTSGTSASYPMDSALGIFGFYCQMHGSKLGSGMAGAIEVVR